MRHSYINCQRSFVRFNFLTGRAPLFCWEPHDPEPNLGAVSYRLKSRWTEPVEPTDVFIATKQANRILGGYIGGRKPRPSETTHDIHLGTVYLWYRENRPEHAAAWVSEHKLYAETRPGERLPDAVIRPGKQTTLVVKFGGGYSKYKLEAFHQTLSELPYEIW